MDPGCKYNGLKPEELPEWMKKRGGETLMNTVLPQGLHVPAVPVALPSGGEG